MNLLIIGSMAYDAIETPFGKTDKILGGAATYISLAASYFQKHTRIVSVVGDDFEQKYLNLLEEHNIDLSGVQIKKGEQSFFWSGKYSLDMNTRQTLDTQLNVLENFDPVIPEEYQDCQYLMLGNLVPAVQKKVIERLHKKPKFIVMDTMNFWMEHALEDLKEVIGMVDLLSINDEEARQLTDEFSLVKASEKILKMGPKFLIIKKGEHGALLFGEDQIFNAPALPLSDVFDPTGAGDSFAGGLTGYLSATDDISFENLKRGVIFGSAMASFTVEKFGAKRLFNLQEKDITNRLDEFIQLSQFDLPVKSV